MKIIGHTTDGRAITDRRENGGFVQERIEFVRGAQWVCSCGQLQCAHLPRERRGIMYHLAMYFFVAFAREIYLRELAVSASPQVDRPIRIDHTSYYLVSQSEYHDLRWKASKTTVEVIRFDSKP